MRSKVPTCFSFCTAFFLLMAACASLRPAPEKQTGVAKFEYNTFAPVSASCLETLKTRVAKDFPGDFVYKNTVGSREPHYREAVFVKISGSADDSVVIVKFDSLCAVKRAYRTKMIVSDDYK